MADIIATYKQNDTWPPLYRQLTESIDEGPEQPINLSTATSMTFLARSGAVTITQPVTASDLPVDPVSGDPRTAAEGWIRVAWDEGDLSNVGTYDCEIEIQWDPGATKIQTVPNGDYFKLIIVDDIGGVA